VAFVGWVLAAANLVAADREITQYRTSPALWSEGGGDSSPVIVNVSKRVYRLVVRTGAETKVGTAFLVSGRRIIATNNHVIDKGSSYVLGYVGEHGAVRWVELELLAVFPQKDLALLEAADDLPGEALPLASDYPELATDLYAIGFPSAADSGEIGPAQTSDRNFVSPSVLKGNVSRIMSGAWLTNQLQHQTPISPGYSGGPLVDRSGVVVGISAAINKEASGISYGVSAPDLARFLKACALPLHTVNLARRTVTEVASTTASLPAERPTGGNDILLTRANEALKRGDIAGARILFEYIARERSDKSAYVGLAQTYDPEVLKMLKVVGNLGDADKAEEFYQMAARLTGAPRAATETASATGCRNSLCMMLENGGDDPSVLCNKLN
jgi:S1-C subfamily serine protease